MVQAASSEAHLRRAYGLVTEVESAIEGLRQSVINHGALGERTDNAQGFTGWLGAVVETMKSTGRVRRDKAALSSDLQLASQELDRAAALDGKAVLKSEQGVIDIPWLRSAIFFDHGSIEMIWGTPQMARHQFQQALQIGERADAHYMLGIVYESEYQPQDALKHFEKCLELDPAGELSVSALREANAMRNYKKGFRGEWGTFLLLLLIWPVAIIYFFRKWK